TSSAENEAGNTGLFAIDGLHVSSAATADLANTSRLREFLPVAQRFGISTLQSRQFAELCKRRATRNHLLCQFAAVFNGMSFIAEVEHPRRKLEAEIAQIGWATAVQHLDALDHFERIAHVATERLVHIGDERDHALAHAHSGINHQLG